MATQLSLAACVCNLGIGVGGHPSVSLPGLGTSEPCQSADTIRSDLRVGCTELGLSLSGSGQAWLGCWTGQGGSHRCTVDTGKAGLGMDPAGSGGCRAVGCGSLPGLASQVLRRGGLA